MRKHVVVAAAALVLAGSSIALAQQFQQGPGREGRMMGPRWQPTAEDIAAFTDARIAGMKAGLRLNADQEKNWPAFEQAYRGLAKQRADRMAARTNEQRADDIVQFMQRRAEIMTQRAQGFKQLADAAAPLYQSLDDGQKRRFTMLSRMLRPRPMMGQGGFDRDRMGPHRMGPGRMHDRGGFQGPRFGEGDGGMQHGGMQHGGMQHGSVQPGSLDDEEMDLAQEQAEELEFANLGRLPSPPPER